MKIDKHPNRPDAELIQLGEEQQRNFWATSLGVSIEKLKSAVRATRSLNYHQIKDYLYNSQSKAIN
jgi:hypothetical protein